MKSPPKYLPVHQMGESSHEIDEHDVTSDQPYLDQPANDTFRDHSSCDTSQQQQVNQTVLQSNEQMKPPPSHYSQRSPFRSRIKQSSSSSQQQRRRQLLLNPLQHHGTPTNNNYDSPTNHSQDSTNSNSHPSSRATTLLFLLFVGFAIIHAIARGFENMHDAKTMGQQKVVVSGRDTGGFAVGTSEENINSIIGESDDAISFSNGNVVNNQVLFDNRNAAIASGGSSVPGSTSGAPQATILSRASQLSSLISNLDASDVVECYVVTRMARLTNVASSSGGNNNANDGGSGNGRMRDMGDNAAEVATAKNSDTKIGVNAKGEGSTATPASASTTNSNIPTGPILIRKSALAFRYRPRVASATHIPHTAGSSSYVPVEHVSQGDQLEQQKYFELTLEYGPQRSGAAKTSESMPMIHVDMELMAEAGNTNGDGNEYSIGKYVSWENEGRVYHSTQISNEWTEGESV